MTYTFESLSQALGCETLPNQLQFYFEKAMAEYDQNGCYLADPAYFRELHDKYGCYPAYLDVFCAAAEQIAQNEVLARYLTLLGMATKDRKRFTADPFEPPLLTPQNGDPALGYEMLNGLAIAAAIPDAAQNMLDKALPKTLWYRLLQLWSSLYGNSPNAMTDGLASIFLRGISAPLTAFFFL